MSDALASALEAFGFAGTPGRVQRWGSGHIHETYRVRLPEAPRAAGPAVLPRHDVAGLLLQRVNHRVFPDPVAVTESIRRVTEHLQTKAIARGVKDVDRRVLTLVPTADDACGHRDEEGGFWRAFLFVDGASSYDVVTSPEMAYRAARAFGTFQRDLADLPLPRLEETLPGFHDTPARFATFREVVERDPAGRVKDAEPEIALACRRERITSVILEAHWDGLFPERNTHNDTKINNVLFDDASREALCVIDLDTVMPGLGLYDFGDMVRTTTSTAAEDERDLTKVVAQPDLFEALARGYRDALGAMLTDGERDLMAFSGQLITFEIGLRFLTDFLQGDVYFATQRPDHNLDRCRAQFALLRSLEAQARTFRRIVRELA